MGRKSKFNYLVKLTVRKTKLKVEVERTKERADNRSAYYLISTTFLGDVLRGEGYNYAVVEDLDSFLRELEDAFYEVKKRITNWKLEVKLKEDANDANQRRAQEAR